MERDDGLEIEEPIWPYLAGRDDWAPEERMALGGARGRVLDLGCGPGRVLVPLQDSAECVGLDRSGTVLRLCRERGGKRLVIGDSVRLPFKTGSFDTMLLMGNGLGMAGGTPETATMLMEAGRVMSRKGILIAHSVDPSHPDSGLDDEYRRRNAGAGRPEGHLRIRARYGGLDGPWFQWLLMGPSEVKRLSALAGFRLRQSIEWGASYIYLASKDRIGDVPVASVIRLCGPEAECLQ